MLAMENNQNNAGKKGASGSKGQQTRQKGQDEEFADCLREYHELSATFHASVSFKDFALSNILSGMNPKYQWTIR
jgi:hypothetical protein